jgi:hypothetical protein
MKLLLETVFYTQFVQRGCKEDNWGNPIIWALSSAREAGKNSVDSLVAGYSPDSNDMNTEAEESPLLRAVTKQRLVKTLEDGEDLACIDL